MRPEHEQRFRRIVSDYLQRPAGDYGELLHRGHVSSPKGVDPEQWRSQIRAQARRDKIRVVTFRDGDRAIAARNRTASDDELRCELDRMQALRQLAAAARALGHEPGSWLRSGEESVSFCSRCDAREFIGKLTPSTVSYRARAVTAAHPTAANGIVIIERADFLAATEGAV
jgi:hypothetical protein